MSAEMKQPALTKERRDWLASLKEGDEVTVLGAPHFPRIRQVTIKNGWPAVQLGGSCSTLTKSGKLADSRRDEWIVPVTDEHRRIVSIAAWRTKLHWQIWDICVADEQIEAIAKILLWDQATKQ